VRITEAGRYIVTTVDGRAMPVTVEEYKQQLAATVIEAAPTLDDFRTHWISPSERGDLLAALPDAGRSPSLVRALDDMAAYDLYDVLGSLAYGMKAQTRSDRVRAFDYKNATWLRALPLSAAATLRALVGQFTADGTEALENRYVFQVPEVARAGGLAALRGMGEPSIVLTETKKRMFAA
jgi:type I restriction enzyme R subunit